MSSICFDSNHGFDYLYNFASFIKASATRNQRFMVHLLFTPRREGYNYEFGPVMALAISQCPKNLRLVMDLPASKALRRINHRAINIYFARRTNLKSNLTERCLDGFLYDRSQVQSCQNAPMIFLLVIQLNKCQRF
jgi:hypothetical protein